MRSGVGETNGGVRTVLLEAVRATDEALSGLDRAERTADELSRTELDRVRFEVQHTARMILEALLGMVEVVVRAGLRSIEVKDRGPGFTDDGLSRAFEPLAAGSNTKTSAAPDSAWGFSLPAS